MWLQLESEKENLTKKMFVATIFREMEYRYLLLEKKNPSKTQAERDRI